MKNTRQKICTTIRDLKLYLVDILSVRAQKIKSTNSTNFYTYYLITYLFLIFYLYKKVMQFTKNTRDKNTSIYFYNH